MHPQTFSHFEIIRKLGEGGMGEVFLAHDLNLRRKVVIKKLSSSLFGDQGSKRVLLREARSASSLDHPNICTIYEVGEVNGESFIAMQYIEGEPLNTYAKKRNLTFAEETEIFKQIASALAESHRKGIIHRDIKPQNILVTKDGLVKVLDFGLAIKVSSNTVPINDAQTQSLFSTQKTLAGTVPYMSPEQACAEDLDAASDVFSLGTVMYELTSGKHPFSRKSVGETVSAILTTSPPLLRTLRPDIPITLERTISKCLEKDKTKRFSNAEELFIQLNTTTSEIPGSKTILELQRSVYKQPKAYLALSLLFAIIIAGAFYLRNAWRKASVKPIQVSSLAVLPLDDRELDKSLNYLSDGLTDSLINSLAEISNVKVLARNSVFRYKAKDIDPQVVGRELNVQAIVVGKIVPHPNGLRIVISLVDARDNTQIWGDIYSIKYEDSLKAETQIAREISDRLQSGASETSQSQPLKTYTDNSQAYQLYLQGRFFWNKRTEDDLMTSIKYFNEAIALDPRYALAYAGLADSYVLLGSMGYDVMHSREAMAKAEEASAKALELDDQLAEAHSSRAIIMLQFRWEWRQAELEFQRAIKLKPNLAVAHYWYAFYLMAAGRREESIAESKRALELDPLSLIANINVARAYHFAKQYDEAIAVCKRVLAMDSSFIWAYYHLGANYELKGMYKEAIQTLQKGVELSKGNNSFVSALAYGYGKSGNKGKAKQLLEILKSSTGPNRATPTDFAIVYLGLGDKDKALDFLDKACDERASVAVSLKSGPVYDELRSEPRFAALLTRVGWTQ